MRHGKSGLKLNRNTSHRKAMFRNMVTSLLKYERIQTTEAKAKELRRWADRLITLAKNGSLHARRQALSIIREPNVIHKLFDNASARFAKSPGGYTRIFKIGRRKGDAAIMTMIELVSLSDDKKADKPKKVKDKADDKKVDKPKKIKDKADDKKSDKSKKIKDKADKPKKDKELAPKTP